MLRPVQEEDPDQQQFASNWKVHEKNGRGHSRRGNAIKGRGNGKAGAEGGSGSTTICKQLKICKKVFMDSICNERSPGGSPWSITMAKRLVWMNDVDQQQFAREFDLVNRMSSISIAKWRKIKYFCKEISWDQQRSMIWINNNLQKILTLGKRFRENHGSRPHKHPPPLLAVEECVCRASSLLKCFYR